MDDETSIASDDLSDESDEFASSESESESDENQSENSENPDEHPGQSTSKRRSTSSKAFEASFGLSELEKICLLDALKDFGTGNLDAICSRIPTKTQNEIKEFMLRQRKATISNLRAGVSSENEAPIDKWIQNLIRLSPNYNYKKQYIARALKYIALFEKREEENEGDVNLK